MPGDDNLFASLRPHNRIPFTGRNDDDDTGAVPVAFFVSLGREHRHMTPHLRARESNLNSMPTRTPLSIGLDLVPGSHIGEKIPQPLDAPGLGAIIGQLYLLGFGIKLFFLCR